jgi:lipopolysaccharide transport system ATP-binding protein
MMIRLAFAVQVHVDPDILIVDEALAVGDARFQAKALTKLDEILATGTTLLFVGHDLNTVKSFCNSAMLLDQGRVTQHGLPDDVISNYLHLIQQDTLKASSARQSAEINQGFSVSGFGVTQAAIEGFGQHASIGFDETINVLLEVSLGEDISDPYLIVDIIDGKGLQLTGKRIAVPPGIGKKNLRLSMQCCFQMGIYRFRLRIVDSPRLEQTVLISRQDDLLSMELVEDVRDRFTGLFPVPITVEWD